MVDGFLRPPAHTVGYGLILGLAFGATPVGGQAPDPTRSTITVSNPTVAAGDQVELLLTPRNAVGSSLTARDGHRIQFGLANGTSDGTISAVDVRDTVYAATLTGVTAGTPVEVYATIEGDTVRTSRPRITVLPGPMTLGQSRTTFAATSVGPDEEVEVRVVFTDDWSNPLPCPPGPLPEVGFEVRIEAEVVDTLPATSCQGGQFSGSYRAGPVGSFPTARPIYDGILDSTAAPARIGVTSNDPDPHRSSVTVSHPTAAAGATVTVTLTARDTAGLRLTAGGATVEFMLGDGTSSGTFGPVTDHGNGAYEASFQGKRAGDATAITATINGVIVSSIMPTITVSPGAPDPGQSYVMVDSLVALGQHFTVRIAVRDAFDNPTTISRDAITVIVDATVARESSRGPEHTSITYEALRPEQTTVKALLDNRRIRPGTIRVSGPPKAANSRLVAPSRAASGTQMVVTLRTRDEAGAPIRTGGAAVTFSVDPDTSLEIQRQEDLRDGTYTAIIKGKSPGPAHVRATVEGDSVTPVSITVTQATVPRLNPVRTVDGWRMLLSLEQINLACRQIALDGSADAAVLRAWCNLRFDALAPGTWNSVWTDTTQTPRPTIEAVVQMARKGAVALGGRGVSDTGADEEAMTQSTIIRFPETPESGRQPSDRPRPSVPTSPADLVLSQGELLLGLADFLVEESRIQVESWAIPLMARSLCGGGSSNGPPRVRSDGLRWLLPASCNLLSGSAQLNLVSAPATFFAAIREDLRGMPATVIDTALSHPDIVERLTQEQRQALAYGRLVYRFLADVARQPVSVARAFSLLDSYDPTLEDSVFPPETALRRDVERTFAQLRQHARLLQQILNVIDRDVLTDENAWAEMVRAILINTRLAENNVTTEVVDSIATGLYRLREVRQHLIHADEALRQLRSVPRAEPDRGAREDGTNGDTVGTANENARRREALFLEFVEHAVGMIEAALGRDLWTDGNTQRQEVLESISTAIGALESGNYPRGLVAVIRLINELGIEDQLPIGGVRILTFASDMASATTAEDVSEALKVFSDAAAARGDKRAEKHGVLLHLQGYGGLMIGSEGLGSVKENLGAVAGAFLPVGLEITLKDSRLGVFLQLIDLGALGTARLTGNEEILDVGNSGQADTLSISRTAEFGFAQVLAPGVFLTNAVKEAPVAWGVGISMTPRLRSVNRLDPSGSGAMRRDAFRVGVFLAIDIPIFP